MTSGRRSFSVVRISRLRISIRQHSPLPGLPAVCLMTGNRGSTVREPRIIKIFSVMNECMLATEHKSNPDCARSTPESLR